MNFLSPSLRLPQKRILSIDAFRGITILTMIFVNEAAGIKNIPEWMKHMPADADAMTFVDVVFPAFLFIVGMSIPFALHQRIKKGDNFFKLQGHILSRTLGLLVLGVFMVNAEGGYNAEASGIPLALWSLLFCFFAILVWNVYSFENKNWAILLRAFGVLGLIYLALIYRSNDDAIYMTPRWWGILGLIGWAYLYAILIFQLFKSNPIGILVMIGICTAIYILGQQDISQHNEWLHWSVSQKGNAAHTSIVLSGILLTLIFFNQKENSSKHKKFIIAGLFALCLFLAGYLLRPYFHISKIYATPTWCFYSAGICTVIFSLMYWIVDLKDLKQWTTFFQPAASNPLLVYIIPFILASAFRLFHFYPVPKSLREGLPGLIWCLIYAIAIMWLSKGLNKLKIRLQL